VHHAGMLPRYRRLVETLAQRGLLRVVCGTDTLGVGINVPIRSVLITALAKFDGQKMRQISAREFHQVAGRAGRAGYDTAGTVVVLAPEHEIENETSVRKAGDDPKKLRKIVRKKAPAGQITWGEGSYDRLVAAEPEPLQPHLQLSAAMLINVIGRGGDVVGDIRSLVLDNHEPRARQYQLARRALEILRTLRDAGVVEILPPPDAATARSGDERGGADAATARSRDERGGSDSRARRDAAHWLAVLRLTVDLQPNFALNQPLSPFALAAIELLDPDAAAGTGIGTGHYALDVVSVIESTLDDPRPILSQQQYKARGEAVAAMKQDGIEYDQRMELLEQVTWPKPLDELLGQAFETFASSQPWVRDFELSPKSVVRDMFERSMSFGEYVSFYQLARSEGLVLRYLSDAFRAIRQTVPTEAKDEELLDIIEWLGELVRQVDSSLVDEWNELVDPTSHLPEDDAPVVPPAPPSVVTNRRAFTVLVRNELFRRVQLAALDHDDELQLLDPGPMWADALNRYYAEHDEILTGAAARSPRLVTIDETDAATGLWRVEQTLDDPAGDHDWRIRAEVDLDASAEEGAAVVRVTEVVRL
ncbi:MAG TPA: DUF3516 domain-containing protein, partial [Agromyces sp.]|nr:DUF3516 domain-containing protein [Agromyces sp.]